MEAAVVRSSDGLQAHHDIESGCGTDQSKIARTDGEHNQVPRVAGDRHGRENATDTRDERQSILGS